MKPEVSLIIPAYSRVPLLRECLESIQAQSLKYWECIVVDDCSPEGAARAAWMAGSSPAMTEGGLGRARPRRGRAPAGAGVTGERGGDRRGGGRYAGCAFPVRAPDEQWRAGGGEEHGHPGGANGGLRLRGRG